MTIRDLLTGTTLLALLLVGCADAGDDGGSDTATAATTEADTAVTDGATADEGAATDDAATADNGRAGTPVTVMLDWTPNTNHAGLYVAQQQGWYADAGLDVEIIQPGEQGALASVASGAAEFGVSVQEELIPARGQGVPVVAVAAIIESNTSAFVALADEGIERPADFAGHRYGGFGGQLETALIETLVACDGGDPEAVEFVEVGNVDYRAGLERDFYDFVWIFLGWDGIRLEELTDIDVTTLPFAEYLDCIPDWYTPLLATSEGLIADDPELVESFMDATARGYAFAIEQPDEAADLLLAAVPELDEDLVTASAAYLADEYAGGDGAWGYQDAEVWQTFTQFLLEAGLIDGTIDVDAAWTNAFLPPRSTPDATETP